MLCSDLLKVKCRLANYNVAFQEWTEHPRQHYTPCGVGCCIGGSGCMSLAWPCMSTRCFLSGRGRTPGTPAFAEPGRCTWPNVGDTPPLLLTPTDPGPGPCALGCTRALSSNSRLTPRETGTGVLVRGGCTGGCVGVGAVAGVEGKGVPTDGGTTEP